MGGLACATKIVLDSGRAAGLAMALTDVATTSKEVDQLPDDVAYPIIEQIIYAEEALEMAHNLLLDAVGYTGPRPGSYYRQVGGVNAAEETDLRREGGS